NLKEGWGIQGCTIHGTGGAQQVGVQVGGKSSEGGGHGVVVSNMDLQGFHRGIQTEQHTWAINVNNIFFQNNDRAVSIDSTEGDSGEGYRFTGATTIADCTGNYGDCFYSDVNGTDGLDIEGIIFDDSGIHLADGNLNATLNGVKWENPGASTFGRYNY